MTNAEMDKRFDAKLASRAWAGIHSAALTSRSLTAIAFSLLTLLVGVILWGAGDVLLLIFTGLLFALLLVNLSRVVQHKTNLSYLWSLAIVVGILAIALGMLTALFATRLASEATGLFETVQSKWQELSAQVQKYPWAPKLDGAPLSSLQNIKGDWISRIAGWFTSTFGMLSSLFLIVFIGIFTAADPNLYRQGSLRLVPIRWRPRVNEVLDETSHKLWWWILGQLFSMSVVGIATGIGLWLLGIPFAATLGLLSGILTFIPNFGPILAAVPAILLGLSHGPMSALYVTLLYIGIQAVESNLLTPLIQQRNVQLPPVLNVGFQVLLGVLFGVPGLIVAAPLAVVAMVSSQRFYVEDYLGDALSPSED